MLVKIIAIMLANTYTTDDLVERLALMRIYYGKCLFTGAEGVALRDVLAHSCSEHTLSILEIWVVKFTESSISPLVVYEALDSIEEEVAGMPSLKLYVPVRFDEVEIERLGSWFRVNVQPNMLLTLCVDPHVAGGCAFIWRDVYYDFSFRYFVNKKSKEMFSMFDTYLHV